jgi:hypothetical protein
VVGIGTIAAESQARLYPNPASDMIHILLPSELGNQRINCRIYDVMGKEVQAPVVNDGMQNTVQVEVSALRSGIYIVQLSGGNYQQSLKFIKQ